MGKVCGGFCIIIEIKLMIFLKISELAAAVATHELSNHEIKGKRIKKELSNL